MLFELYEEWPSLSAALLAFYSRMFSIPALHNSQINQSLCNMRKAIIMRLEIRLDCEKAKPTKVAPYVRFRNGKKELVKGYVRKNREL